MRKNTLSKTQKKKQTTEKLKPHFEQILILIYKFRFLNRIQIQSIFNHKKFSRIIIWLNYLTDKKCLIRYYSPEFAGRPAYYSLGTKGRKYFLKNKDIQGIQHRLLDRVWVEHTYTYRFKNHCMFLGDVYISLIRLTRSAKAKLDFYTKTDLTGMRYFVRPAPDSYFSIKDTKDITKRYFLDIFEPYPNDDELYKRSRQYLYYFKKEHWQDNTGKPFPEIIIICSENKTKNYFNKIIGKMLEKENVDILFYLSTKDEIKLQGLNRKVLHKVE